MRSWLRYGGLLFLIVTLASFDAAFFPAIGSSTRSISMILVASLYTIVILREQEAILIFVASTVLLGFTASDAILFPLAIGLLTLTTVNALFIRFFTNRSYYSLLALGTFGWLMYNMLFDFSRFATALIIQSQYAPVFDGGWVIAHLVSFIFLIISLSLAYIMTVFLSKRFRSYFIITDKQV